MSPMIQRMVVAPLAGAPALELPAVVREAVVVAALDAVAVEATALLAGADVPTVVCPAATVLELPAAPPAPQAARPITPTAAAHPPRNRHRVARLRSMCFRHSLFRIQSWGSSEARFGYTGESAKPEAVT